MHSCSLCLISNRQAYVVYGSVKQLSCTCEACLCFKHQGVRTGGGGRGVPTLPCTPLYCLVPMLTSRAVTGACTAGLSYARWSTEAISAREFSQYDHYMQPRIHTIMSQVCSTARLPACLCQTVVLCMLHCAKQLCCWPACKVSAPSAALSTQMSN